MHAIKRGLGFEGEWGGYLEGFGGNKGKDRML